VIEHIVIYFAHMKFSLSKISFCWAEMNSLGAYCWWVRM